MSRDPVLRIDLPGVPVRRGKVRDVFDFGDRLLFVATDRISAFDHVLPDGIPDKGRLLTALSAFWFARCGLAHHLLGTDPSVLPLPAGTDLSLLEGRSLVVRKTEVIPIECVVRGYLAGSGWKEYRAHGSVCGIALPPGLVECDRLPEPVFTPATKAQTGHDENISFAETCDRIGAALADTLRQRSLELYREAAEYARTRGILVADTKFEFGLLGQEVLLVDEILTPDSSRFWPADRYVPGRPQPSFDKQFVRDWLEESGWDKDSPPPRLPEDIVRRTRAKYVEAYEILTNQAFAWR
jgi:phosphoribosylaminoimidazole-succinocarboxamide synthase